jgi:hypothetical protein
MAIVYKKSRAIFSDVVGGEEAEELLEWLHKHPKGKIDLAACTHLHPANLQVMMAAQCSIYVRPSDNSLANWVDSALEMA